MFKTFFKVLLGLLLLVLIAAIVLFHSMTFRKSDADIQKQFTDVPVPIQVETYQAENKQMRYVLIAKEDSLPLVIFVHGAPGGLDMFLDYFQDPVLLNKVRMISVDRSGYGYSDFGIVEPSIERQAALIQPILTQHKNEQAVILVGHSFGGPIAARLTMDYPDLVDGLILAAAAVDPEHENIFAVSPLLEKKWLNWIMPKVWRVTNTEKLTHVEELKKMLPLWKNITIPTTIIQGNADNLVPKENGDFAEKMLVNAPQNSIRPKDVGHVIPMNNPELISDAILKHLYHLPPQNSTGFEKQ
ncbi:MAG: alpha/beta fold hydrolase [Chitinophagales bacterium]